MSYLYGPEGGLSRRFKLVGRLAAISLWGHDLPEQTVISMPTTVITDYAANILGNRIEITN